MVNNVLLWRNTEPANTFLVQGDQYKTSNLQNCKIKIVLFKPLNLLKIIIGSNRKQKTHMEQVWAKYAVWRHSSLR